MNCELSPDERRRYEAWMHSPSVFSKDPAETILAYKIAKIVNGPPSRVLKALRGVEGVDPALRAKVEAFVSAETNLDFRGESPQRLVVMTARP